MSGLSSITNDSKGKRINLIAISLEARSSSIEALTSLGRLYGWGKCRLSTHSVLRYLVFHSAAHQPRIAQNRALTSFVHCLHTNAGTVEGMELLQEPAAPKVGMIGLSGLA